MAHYKFLNRFQVINCAECESSDQLTVNEYTDDVLCLTCLKGLLEKDEWMMSKQDIDEIKGDELYQRMKDDKLEY